MTVNFKVSDVQALTEAARIFKAQAERFGREIEILSELGIHSAQTGAHDLDSLVGSKMDEIIEALAGEGGHLQQTSMNLATVVENYQNTDGHVAGKIDAIHW